ncbi:MAG TPA: DUF924 family protein, partial [Kofleriaceae bacterium]|nr:DUF924 family protein [Kofleriaceae bacterium]
MKRQLVRAARAAQLARAFAADHAALEIARELRRAGRSHELTFHQRMIALMPFQHAEDRSTQVESVAAFESLVA